jgi:prolyl 4-hydroxylase
MSGVRISSPAPISMIEHNVNKLDNFICGFYIQDNLCDEIIEFHKNTKNKSPGKVGYDSVPKVDTKVKDSIDASLTDRNLLEKYVHYLQKSVAMYVEKYPYCDQYSPWRLITEPIVQFYKPGGGYFDWHTERTGNNEPGTSRHLVYMTYLNDVTDGGETEFYHQKLKIKPEKGLTLIWPADWTFTHRGITSNTQEKYIVTGWFNFVK